jgi:hypothetical protein
MEWTVVKQAKIATLAALSGPIYLGCAVSSVVEHYLDTVGVTGSNPVSRTIITLRSLTIGVAVCRGYASARLPDCKVVRAE